MRDHAPSFIVAVVDDDRRILESLQALLESANYVVRVFDSAQAMLESECLSEIDCLISDVGMPVMDGFELARAVLAARPKLPVILISGRSDAIARASESRNDRLPLFRKPFDGSELLAAVAGALQKVRLLDAPL